jgi:hypothetical protein
MENQFLKPRIVSTLGEHAEYGRRLIAIMGDNMRETRDILASARRVHAEAIRMAKEEQEELGRRLHASLQGRLSCWTSSTGQLPFSGKTTVTA